jgi:hypothetical protein
VLRPSDANTTSDILEAAEDGELMTVTKAQIHELVDRLPESELGAVERVLGDPLLRALLCPLTDDEPLIPEEIHGILEAKRDAQEGRIRRFGTVEELISDLNADEQQ